MPYYHVAITKKTGRRRWAFAINMSHESVKKEIVTPLTQQKMFMCGKSMVSPIDIESIVISETEEPASKILARTRMKRIVKKFFSDKEGLEGIDEWAVINEGKDVTRKLMKGFNISAEIVRMPSEVPKHVEKKQCVHRSW